MGDWEDIFGVGTGDKTYFGEPDDPYRDTYPLDRMLDIGCDLRRAPTLFDLTGQVWHPTSDPRSILSLEKLEHIDRIARDAVVAFHTDVAENSIAPLDIYVEDWGEIASIFLVHAQRAIDSVGPSLNAIEACLISIVEQVDCDLVLARDTSFDNGHVSRTLSSHIIAFPEEQYVARLGDLTLRGPYCTYSPRGEWAHEITVDSFRGLANEQSGRKVLAVSPSLLDLHIPIRSASEWAMLNRGSASPVNYGVVAAKAASLNGPCRTWTDAAEVDLRKRVYEILCAILPEPTDTLVVLETLPSGSRLHLYNCIGDDLHDPVDSLIAIIFWHIDLSSFRAYAEDILLLDSVIPSEQSKKAGIAHLLQLFDRIGVDTSVAYAALQKYDHRTLLLLMEPRALDDDFRGRKEYWINYAGDPEPEEFPNSLGPSFVPDSSP